MLNNTLHSFIVLFTALLLRVEGTREQAIELGVLELLADLLKQEELVLEAVFAIRSLTVHPAAGYMDQLNHARVMNALDAVYSGGTSQGITSH